MPIPKSTQVGPQTYNVKHKALEKISRFQTVQSIRIRTEAKEKPDFYLYDNKVPGPGSCIFHYKA